MPQTKEITVYTLAELKEKDSRAYETALTSLAQFATEDGFDFVLDNARTMADVLGIAVKDIFFSGFSNQGDGACVTGSYSYKRGSVAEIRKIAPKDVELNRIAKELQTIQSRNNYRLTATMEHFGNYYHSRSVRIDIEGTADNILGKEAEERLAETIRDFSDWIYKSLETEYAWRTSEETLAEDAAMNEWTFDANGHLA